MTPPALPVAVKSRPVADSPAQPTARGRSQAAMVGKASRPKSATVSPAAPDGRKRAAAPLHEVRVLLKFAVSSTLPLSISPTPAPPRLPSTSRISASMESRSRDDGEAPGSLLTILSFNLHLMSDFAGLPHLLRKHRPHLAFVQITPHTSIAEAAAAAGYSTFLSTSLSRPKRTIAVLSRVPVQVSSPFPGYSQLLSLGDLSFFHLCLPAAMVATLVYMPGLPSCETSGLFFSVMFPLF
jgi:hypothetical protein